MDGKGIERGIEGKAIVKPLVLVSTLQVLRHCTFCN